MRKLYSKDGILQAIGFALFSLYWATVYLAQDLVLPSRLNSISLYVFLGWGVLYLFVVKKFKFNLLTIWMAIFMALCLLTMVYSPIKGILSGEYYTLLVNFILVVFLSQIDFNKSSFYGLLWVSVLSSVILILFLILTGHMNDSTGRLGADAFGNANIMAMILMSSVMYALYLLAYQRCNWFLKIILVIAIALNYYAMFLSGGRKFVVVPILFFYVLLLFKKDKNGDNHIIRYTVIIGGIILIGYWLIMNIPQFYNAVGIRMQGLFNTISGEGDSEASAVARGNMMEFGLNKWIKKPVLGYGFDSFKYYYGKATGVESYAHNNFVELLFDLGFIGFSVYYIFYGYVIQRGFSKKYSISTSLKAFSVAMICSLLLFEFGAITYTTTPVIIMLYMAYVAQGIEDEEEF